MTDKALIRYHDISVSIQFVLRYDPWHPMTDLVTMGSTPRAQCDTPTDEADCEPTWYGRLISFLLFCGFDIPRNKNGSWNLIILDLKQFSLRWTLSSNHLNVNLNFAENQHCSQANFKSKQCWHLQDTSKQKRFKFIFLGCIDSNDQPGNVCYSVSGQANVGRPGHHVIDAMSFRTVPTGGGSPTRARQNSCFDLETSQRKTFDRTIKPRLNHHYACSIFSLLVVFQEFAFHSVPLYLTAFSHSMIQKATCRMLRKHKRSLIFE